MLKLFPKQAWLGVLSVAVVVLLVGTSSAQRPDAPFFAERGPYIVGTQDFVIDDAERPLDVAIWYPALNPDDLPIVGEYQENIITIEGEVLRDAPVNLEDGPYPLVVFSHGSRGFRYQSLFLTEHLASQGFIVIAPNHPGNTIIDSVFDSESFGDNVLVNYALRPLDILRVIDFAETLAAEDALFAGMNDLERLAVAGHSFGGYTTLAVSGGLLNLDDVATACAEEQDGGGFCGLTQNLEGFGAALATLRGLDSTPSGDWPATSDPRISAIVLLAPAGANSFSMASLGDIEIPSLFIVGSADTVTPAEREAYVMHGAIGSEQKTLLTLENAGHYIFVDACIPLAISFDLFDSCSDPVWDMARVHDLTNHATTAFLRDALLDDPLAADALLPENMDFVGVRYETNR